MKTLLFLVAAVTIAACELIVAPDRSKIPLDEDADVGGGGCGCGSDSDGGSGGE